MRATARSIASTPTRRASRGPTRASIRRQKLAQGWVDAARSARTFATTGPIVTRFAVDGVRIGGVRDASPGDQVIVDFAVTSATPLDSVRVIGVDGPVHAVAWPEGSTEFVGRFELDVTRDEFLVLDARGSERPTARLYAPRVVTSPVWIRTGVAWDVPPAVTTRARDAMQTFWDLSVVARGYASAADSSRAYDHTRRPADGLATRVSVPASW